mgnify:CR=1 FL=1
MFFDIFKKKSKKNTWPPNAKYQLRDFVRFRHRGEICCGIIYQARVDEDGNVLYTVQIGGECPILINDYKEENIVDKVN